MRPRLVSLSERIGVFISTDNSSSVPLFSAESWLSPLMRKLSFQADQSTSSAELIERVRSEISTALPAAPRLMMSGSIEARRLVGRPSTLRRKLEVSACLLLAGYEG